MYHKVIELTKQLIKQKSITPEDADCQLIIADRLKKLNFNIQHINYKKTFNIFAHRGNGKHLALAGHTDVVPIGNIKDWTSYPFTPLIKNGILYGRGAVDMKGAIAAMIIATEEFINEYPKHPGKISFLITSDEEGTGNYGTKKIIEYLINNYEKIDYCILGEPSSKNSIGDIIKNGRRGSLSCNITIYGIQGHVAYSSPKYNPINLAVPLMSDLINIKLDAGNKDFPPTTLQLTNIKTIDSTDNVTPSKILIKFNCRFNNISTEKIIRKKIQNLIKNYTLKYNITWNKHAQPFITKKGKLINAVIKAVSYYQNNTPKIETSGGTSDGRFIKKICPEIVELGVQNKSIHQANEHVNTLDLWILTKIYKKVIEYILYDLC